MYLLALFKNSNSIRISKWFAAESEFKTEREWIIGEKFGLLFFLPNANCPKFIFLYLLCMTAHSAVTLCKNGKTPAHSYD